VSSMARSSVSRSGLFIDISPASGVVGGHIGLAAFFFQAPFGIALKRTKHSPAREHHRTAIFGGVDQHVNGKSPFLSMAL
jgi:hypothetical protein